MGELIRILGFQMGSQIIVGLQLACVVELMLRRKYISLRKGLVYLFGLIFIDIVIAIYKGGASYYTGIIIILIFIIYKGKLVHKLLAMCISIGISCAAELLNEVILGYMIHNIRETGAWGAIFLQIANVIPIVLGIIIFKSTRIFLNNKKEFKDLSKNNIFALGGLSILTIFMLGIGIMIYDGAMIATYNSKFIFVVIISVLLLNLSSLIIIDKNIHAQYYQKINALMEKQLVEQVNYYSRLKEATRDTRALKHDMVNHIMCFKGLLKLGKIKELSSYIESIEDIIKTNAVDIVTGNLIVDTIMNEKYKIAQEKKIKMDIDIVLFEEMNIHMVDLCIMISNGIDNAIEACEKIPTIENRWIKVTGRYKQGYFMVDIINTSLGHVNIENNTIMTTKKDKGNHGYGLENIKNSVNKYKGNINLSYNENKFTLQIIINTSCV